MNRLLTLKEISNSGSKSELITFLSLNDTLIRKNENEMDGQTDGWATTSPSITNTHIHTTPIHPLKHMHSNTHMHTLFPPETERTALYSNRMYSHYKHFYQR